MSTPSVGNMQDATYLFDSCLKYSLIVLRIFCAFCRIIFRSCNCSDEKWIISCSHKLYTTLQFITWHIYWVYLTFSDTFAFSCKILKIVYLKIFWVHIRRIQCLKKTIQMNMKLCYSWDWLEILYYFNPARLFLLDVHEVIFSAKDQYLQIKRSKSVSK